jgi:hypothetical protein
MRYKKKSFQWFYARGARRTHQVRSVRLTGQPVQGVSPDEKIFQPYAGRSLGSGRGDGFCRR